MTDKTFEDEDQTASEVPDSVASDAPAPRRSGAGPTLLQAKLMVGAADDAYEREADAVAATVVQALRTNSSETPLEPGVVAWTLSMIHAAVANFDGLLEEVAGGLTLDDALARLDEAFASLTEPAT